MSPTVMDALAAVFPEPPRPDPPKLASSAFQRRLAQQHAALRSEADREASHEPQREASRGMPRRPAVARGARESARAQRSGSERDARAGAGSERQNADAAASLPPGGFGGASGGGGNGGGQGGQQGQGSGQGGPTDGAAPTAPLAADAGFDCAQLLDLLDLLPAGGEGGIFELVLPGGERLGVVADLTPRQGTFLLTPSSERLRRQLSQRKMELEKGLAQRMDRHVRLTVL